MGAEAHCSLEERTKLLLAVLLKEIRSLPRMYTRWRERETLMAFSQLGREYVEILQRARVTCGLR